MSEDLYPVRVFYEGGRGCAKMPGLYRRLTTPPEIPGLPVIDALDYAPKVVAIIRPLASGPRDLDPKECAAIDAWLRAMKNSAAEGQSTWPNAWMPR